MKECARRVWRALLLLPVIWIVGVADVWADGLDDVARLLEKRGRHDERIGHLEHRQPRLGAAGCGRNTPEPHER